MVEQYQPPAASVSRYRKVLRDFKANLIRIGTDTTLALCRGNASAVGDKFGIGGWSEGYSVVTEIVKSPDVPVHAAHETLQ